MQRRPELDALRVAVVLGLVFFHAALVFDESDDFYVKNSETTGVTTVLAGFGVVWAMPLLFAVAGIGSWHSMRRRGPGGFAAERLLRLGVPLVFATLTIVPIPQWLRYGAREPYWRFWLSFFDVRLAPADFPFVLRGEYFETGHLWFVVLLLTFALMLAAAVRWIPRGGWADRLAAAAERPGVVFLPALPVALICAGLGLDEGFAAWDRWAYLLFFLYGYALAADPRSGAAVRRHAKPAAVLGPLAFLASAPAFVLSDEDPFLTMAPLQIVCRFFFGLAGWFCLVAILGLLDRRRPAEPPPPAAGSPAAGHSAAGPAPVGPSVVTPAATGGRRLFAYLAAAALPFYVLHQPIVVAVAYGVVPWDAPIVVEWLVIVVISLVLVLIAFDLGVRRTRVTRFLFGMRRATRRADLPAG